MTEYKRYRSLGAYLINQVAGANIKEEREKKEEKKKWPLVTN